MTRVLQVDPQHPDPMIIAEAGALIRAGDLVAFPTETVYGLGANAREASAVERIFAAKRRPSSDPVIVHIALIEELAEVAEDIPPVAHTLIERFWPGPLTLVLKRGPLIPPNVSAGLPTVGVRMPAHPVAKALIMAAGVPIAAPSANLFSHTSPTTAQHVLEDLDGRIPMIIDAGSTHVGVESTILDLSGEYPRLLRPGGVPLDAILRFAPEIEIVNSFIPMKNTYEDPGEALLAPGMLLRHYSPRAEVRLFEGDEASVRRAMVEAATMLRREGVSPGLLVAEEDLPELEMLFKSFSTPVAMIVLGSVHNLDNIARALFAALREFDARRVDVILARLYPTNGIGQAIRDRMVRAAEGRIKRV